ncbi:MULTISPECIES: succinate dehydrogenase, hydrophobic membrane anchor protein [Maritimibacter]|jgi:succinate dehydrogenase / fumarate reductase membrane anchor subunit|uniref:Succinate dehydrogenase hydrophobic membrane anchor subunit n=1 Tax=Maritimibacter alkaliphilus HTCC2654 TaxID=314271 RepID=A3VBV6_9RHOB|nr:MULTISPECIES: succinate dehydrogenase, hydrophobic membrane anchor protein [Maritimibacter]EAQ14439.1 succinate dehydrogenase, hydrophobic membrane anchor protein [Rhodobacterales bacterium HTCC2654] [Maritimibacter alkaliphilus HTCC2654]MBL6427187.1 succinate dehydrogenase, hydrophobic membrane anchor protein [Maritimibacter sp.]TYP82470.1 succinate dehydrogenase subunit D [Maritimibacter alkaliphilus HTCC2654]
MRYQTDRARVEGLGSAKQGTGHFWEQRISAIALLFLVPLFVFPFAYNLGDGYEAVRAAYAHPVNAIIAIAFFLTAFLHLFQGVQVVVEDYVHGRAGMVIIIATRLLCTLFALVGVYAVIRISLGA